MGRKPADRTVAVRVGRIAGRIVAAQHIAGEPAEVVARCFVAGMREALEAEEVSSVMDLQDLS